MKRLILVIALYLTFPYFGGINGYSQPNMDRKRDMQWLMGYESNFHHLYPIAGHTRIDFNSGVPVVQYDSSAINFDAFSASLCDTSGNLVIVSNGTTIQDSLDRIIPGGDSLMSSGIWQQFHTLGSKLFQGGISIIPIPCNNDCAILLYPNAIFVNSGVLPIGTDYTGISLSTPIHVTRKNIPIIAVDSLAGGGVTACRHGNGRDWWLINPSFGLRKYNRALLSVHGITTLPQQSYSAPSSHGITQSYTCFAPNGTKYAHLDPTHGVWYYDFDRCTGLVSNRQLIDIQTSTVYCQMAFSPNSRFIYVVDRTVIYQFDTDAIDIAASKQIVATHDGFADEYTYHTYFGFPQLGPDSKIYISSWSSELYWHCIDKPDLLGTACDVRQHSIRLATTCRQTMPNFPNFRLGAWKGSPCDSLGIEAGPTINTVGSPPPSEGLGEALFFLSPNPATEGVCRAMFFEPLQKSCVLEVTDALGRVVQSHRLEAGQTYITLDTKGLLSGMYAVSIKGQAVVQKMMVINTE